MLDSLRMIAAVWVAMGHGARLPLWDVLDTTVAGWRALVLVNNGIFNGVAAVMVFFVISGLVIHLPYVAQKSISIKEFYARRLIRVVGPAVVVYGIVWMLGSGYLEALEAVLWSIYCEVLYYLAYPAIHPLARRFSMNAVLATATLAAIVILLASHPVFYFWQLPLLLMALAAFPCWILGCKLAELFCSNGWADLAIGRGEIWVWRLSALALQAALKCPVTHGPVLVGGPESHWVFAVFALFWLSREISHAKTHAPPAWLERTGACTYSLYLIHNPILHSFQVAKLRAPSLAVWLVQAACIVTGTYLFFKLVEQPFHRLARKVAAWRWDDIQRTLCGLLGFPGR